MHGVRFTGGGEIEVNVWAPLQKVLKLKNLSTGETTEMTRIQRGYFSLVTGGNNGDRYLLFLHLKLPVSTIIEGESMPWG